MRLLDLYCSLYRPQKLIGRASSTGIQYRHAIAVFGPDAELSEVSDASFAEFMQRRLDTGISRASVNKERRHLMALFNFAAKRGLMVRRPDVPAIPEHRRIPRAWTIGEIGLMLMSAEREKYCVGQVKAAAFWRAFILALYDTGVRKSALLNAKPDDYAPDTRMLWIRAENQKRLDERVLPLSQQTADALAEIAGPWKWLFPWPHDRYRNAVWKTLNAHFRRILTRAELPATGKFFHKLRASQASYVELVSPGSAQSQLGHTSPIVTRRYLDPLILAGVSQSRLVDRLPRP